MGPDATSRNIKILGEGLQRHEETIDAQRQTIEALQAEVLSLRETFNEFQKAQAIKDIMNMGSGPTGG
ncbi:hypothetical protein DRQ50_00065 [bacterium]|nr:MAG: hypothetical protein DRQ50_00065 [bacterium]RKZ70859.1 MAG: hypothetical protein DRQ48_05375 [Gammaproteobacteria bacterium]